MLMSLLETTGSAGDDLVEIIRHHNYGPIRCILEIRRRCGRLSSAPELLEFNCYANWMQPFRIVEVNIPTCKDSFKN